MTCGAKKKRGGVCGKPAGHGTDHPGIGPCKLHGGQLPNVVRHHLPSIAEDALLGTGGLALANAYSDVEPLRALVFCVHRTAGQVQFYAERIAELEADELLVRDEEVTTRPLKEEKGAEDPGHTVEERKSSTSVSLHAWIKAHDAAVERLARYSALALKAGVEERLLQIEEAQVLLMASALRGILEDLSELTGHDLLADPRAAELVKHHMNTVDGTAVEEGV